MTTVVREDDHSSPVEDHVDDHSSPADDQGSPVEEDHVDDHGSPAEDHVDDHSSPVREDDHSSSADDHSIPAEDHVGPVLTYMFQLWDMLSRPLLADY